jgi:hypothetical protein
VVGEHEALIAADPLHALGGGGGPDNVQLVSGDLAEDPRRAPQRHCLAQHGEGGALATLAGGMPVLDARPVNACHVARREDRRRAGAMLDVGHDAVVHRQPGIRAEAGPRRHADRQEHQIGADQVVTKLN